MGLGPSQNIVGELGSVRISLAVLLSLVSLLWTATCLLSCNTSFLMEFHL
jgi:hypothetical protein